MESRYRQVAELSCSERLQMGQQAQTEMLSLRSNSCAC